jgi:hypothetical protein
MNDLIAILQHIEKRPGMYFGDGERSRSIRILQAFITGFQCAQEPKSSNPFDCFTQWVATRYRVLADSMGAYDLILEHVGGDERKAYDEFFRLLPEYLRDRQQLGFEGILSRFSEVQEPLWEAFRKDGTDDRSGSGF